MQITKRGDTIIEVVFSFAVFATVSVAATAIMNSGLNQAQRALEGTMARNELHSQAEAIRFIHNGFSAERNFSDTNYDYSDLWKALVKNTVSVDRTKDGSEYQDVNNYKTCKEVYTNQVTQPYIYALNPRYLIPKQAIRPVDYINKKKNMIVSKSDTNATDGKKILREPSLYPRISFSEDDSRLDEGLHFYNKAYAIEGIWAFTVAGKWLPGTNRPQYYDFYIRTCWQSASSKALSTISTIIRLYNPEAFE